MTQPQMKLIRYVISERTNKITIINHIFNNYEEVVSLKSGEFAAILAPYFEIVDTIKSL